MDNWYWSAEEIKRVGYQVVDRIADHLTQLPEQPAFQPFPQAIKEMWAQTAVPQQGQTVDEILQEIDTTIAPYPFGNGHPRYYAWINSQPAIVSIFAEALAAAWNPSCAGGNHAAIYVEHQVLDWFKQLIGLPPESMGLLVSGGSMATLTALTVARHVKAGWDVRRRGMQGSERKLTVYTSQEGHSCIRKAVELLGIGHEQLRLIPVDGAWRMDVAALATAVAQDLAAGYQPIAVAASAGSVNTGAIDPLAEIADLCREYNLWFHVDGAYGVPAILTDQYYEQLQPLARVDSLALDPHKWMYIPVEAGLVLVRDKQAMRDAFSLVPPYLRFNEDAGEVSGPPWFSEYGFQQTRGFRALKVWMALKHHGWDGYKAAINHDIALAEHLAELVRVAPDLELMEPTSLSIVCFRYVPPQGDRDQAGLNRLNEALLKKLQLSGEAFLSGTTLRGQFVLRACVVNPRSSAADIEALVVLVQRLGKLVCC